MNNYIIKKESIKIYNSYTKKKDLFSPIHNKYIGMYVCGPTVYKKTHLGNYRTFIFFDIVFRYFKSLGYKVRYVRNITDVGHLENNRDKILASSILEKIEPMEIAQKYTVYFHDMHNIFNILYPSIEPTATGHIIDQLSFIQRIMNNGFAYENNGSIYFDINKYNQHYQYGVFQNISKNSKYYANNNLDKKNFIDFALWKKAYTKHIMQWNSPWGVGFPGWHIECTAMSNKYLGSRFDIHGGGIDLKFPHHECELSQSKSVYGKSSANYWMHVNLLTFKNKKISKSADNFFNLEDIISGKNSYFIKSFHPIVLKFFLLQSHYRNILDISNESLLQAEKNYNFILRAIIRLNNINDNSLLNNMANNNDIMNWCESCYQAMSNDFNTSLLISYMLKGAKYINLIQENYIQVNSFSIKIFKYTFNKFFFDILGLQDIYNKIFTDYKNTFNLLINLIIKLRHQYRINKNWEVSDLIRKELNDLGISLQDNNNKTIFTYDSSFNK
jgi:cysteinyl-tRNA synthetase